MFEQGFSDSYFIRMLSINKARFTISIFTAFLLPAFALLARSEDASVPEFAFSWYENGTFAAGDVADIKVEVLGSYEGAKYKHHFDPNITVNGRIGNSSYISGVSSFFGDDVSTWKISFIPILVGSFDVLLTDENFHVLDSSLQFHAVPGKMYPSAGIVLWADGVTELVAGSRARILVLPKDAFGNNVSFSNGGLSDHNVSISSTTLNGSFASIRDIQDKGWDNLGYLNIDFVVETSGSLLLHVQVQNQSLISSPMPFKVNPGTLDIASCLLRWRSDTSSFQLFSMMEGFIHQHDQYGNLVPGFYEFDVEVIEKWTNLSMPVSDLVLREASPGILLFSFSLMEPGNFTLLILDKDQSSKISNVPFNFTVYIGYCHGVNSVVNGSGLNNSVSGEEASFSVFLRDAYQYPSPVELQRLQVKILHESTLQQVQPIIGPQNPVNGTDRTSAFKVTYVPEKSGKYEISISCGNIALNDGQPFRKEVIAGKVNLSLSEIVNFTQKVAKLTKNEILVRLVDSHSNLVVSQQSRLKLEMAALNGSGFWTTMFVEKSDGSDVLYSCTYLAKDVGTFEVCASYDGQLIRPCPLGLYVYASEYFPRVFNDTVSVWEDESTAFNPLQNDFFAGGNASFVESSMPDHGSLLQYGGVFRYTPHKGFYGNDSFVYVLSDVNGNSASGFVNVAVLSVPPQFVSFPSKLQGTEGLVSPRFSGFSGFEMVYSNSNENLTVILNAKHGTVFLSPMLMQFWQPQWRHFAVNQEIGTSKELTLHGGLESINGALHAIQYVGEEHFCGEDALEISSMNRNGMNSIKVPVFVEPINDPPFVRAPTFIFLEYSGHDDDQVLIFDRKRDKFDFLIGDPDLATFPENKSRFLVMLSMEVISGSISTSLPADLISTTELKFKSSYQWQPLLTFVTISKHFHVKAKGIRFRGSIDECNSILEQLMYNGDKHGDVLTVKVNDLGSYGCYPNCDEKTSAPLFAEATINLVRRHPMSSLIAHTLGSAVVIEFIAVLSLGIVLLFFTCKCSFVLIREKKRKKKEHDKDIELSQDVGTSDKQAV